MTNGGYLKCGSWIDQGGGFTYGTGTVEFTGAFTLPSAAAYNSFYNLIISSSGTISQSAFMYVYGNITFKSGTYSTGGGSGNGMYVYKDWNVTGGTFSSGTGAQCYVGFQGNTDQHIDASSFHWIYFATTVGNIYLDGDITITQSATFYSRIVYGRYGASNYKLIFADGADAAGENGAAFFNGAVKKIGNDAFQFPIGKGATWAPLDIINPPNITDAFTAEYFNVAYSSLTPVGGAIDHVSNNYYWQLDQNNGSSSIDVKLYWKNNLLGVDDLSTLVVARWTGSLWEDLGGITSGNPNTDGDCRTANPVPTTPLYGPFTLASTSSSTNPLPVKWLSFDAVSDGTAIDLTWQTASETNCDRFVVERSQNGNDFSDVVEVKGAGNSSTLRSYRAADPDPYAGTSYYRLLQFDLDGRSYLSNTIAVRTSAAPEMDVYPSPSSGDFHVVLNAEKGKEVQLVVRDLLGKEFYSKGFILDDDVFVQSLNLSGKLSPGVYFITASSDRFSVEKKIVIR